jgi:WD40 repeat protein
VVGTRPDSSLWLRAIGSETARQIPGTEGARPRVSGWSPDSQAIVFATSTQIKRVSIDGGDPVTLGDLRGPGPGGFRGVSWSPNGERIVFSSQGGLWEIPALGGEPRILLAGGQGSGPKRMPHFLLTGGGSEVLVYTGGTPIDRQIWVMNLESGEKNEIAPRSRPVYSPSGHLIHNDVTGAGLEATPFSIETLTAIGDTFPLEESGTRPSVAGDGTLIYTDAVVSGGSAVRIVVMARSVEVVQTVGPPVSGASDPAVSSDGRFVAASVEGDIWIYDLDWNIGTRLTASEGPELSPAWLSSSREVAYLVGTSRWASRVADGSVDEKILLDSEVRAMGATAWSSDNRYYAYNSGGSADGEEGGIWYHERGADGTLSEATPYLLTPAGERAPNSLPMAAIWPITPMSRVDSRSTCAPSLQLLGNGRSQPTAVIRRDGRLTARSCSI